MLKVHADLENKYIQALKKSRRDIRDIRFTMTSTHPAPHHSAPSSRPNAVSTQSRIENIEMEASPEILPPIVVFLGCAQAPPGGVTSASTCSLVTSKKLSAEMGITTQARVGMATITADQALCLFKSSFATQGPATTAEFLSSCADTTSSPSSELTHLVTVDDKEKQLKRKKDDILGLFSYGCFCSRR